ncbi:MAG: hypothetical protein JW809_14355 [Pirellulales bacterium]|nr:hypothetical protein [Pirellulales bacterium]
MKKTLFTAAIVVAAWAGLISCVAAPAVAQDAKPMVTISFSGYDALMSDINTIGKLGGTADLSKVAEAMLQGPTKGQGLVGVDPKRPWGLAVTPDPMTMVSAYAFIPVTDLKQLLGLFEGAGMPSEDAGNGVTRVGGGGGPTAFIKQQGDWAFVAMKAEHLAGVSADPLALLGGVEKRYDLAASIHMGNIPPMLKQMVVAQFETGAQMGLVRGDEETDEEYAVRKKLTQQMVDQTRTMFNDLETVVLGLAVDDKTESAYLDVEVSAKAGSKTADELAMAVPGKSRFAGFALPEAALTVVTVQKLSPRAITDALNNLQNGRLKIQKELDKQDLPAEEADKAKQLIGDVMGVLEETIKGGEADAGGCAFLNPGAVTAVFGAGVADGTKLDKVIRELATTAMAESPELSEAIKLDAETHDGVALHTLAIPIPAEMDNREKIVQCVGETLNVVIGTDAKSVYMGIGPEALAKLKAAIDQSKSLADKEVPPMRMTVAALPVAQFIATMADEPKVKQAAQTVAMTLAQVGNTSGATVTSMPVENGARTRLEIDKGILGVLGQMAGMATMMVPPPGN